MLFKLGNHIERILPYIPNGVIIFFKNYSLANDCFDLWKDEFKNYKKCYLEPKDNIQAKRIV